MNSATRQATIDSRLTAGVPLKSQEHADLMAQFEREHSRHPIAKETKDLWAKGHIYANGQINELFLLYRRGYTLGKQVALAAAAREVA